MKCQKCGYVSFDFLSECKNCRMDLTAVRDGMGMLALRPQTPSCLESILKDYQGTAARAPKQEQASFESTLPPLDLDDEPVDLMATPERESLKEIILEDTDIKFDDSEITFEAGSSNLGQAAPLTTQSKAKPSSTQELIELDVDFLLDEKDLSPASAPTASPPSASKPVGAAAKQDTEDDLVIEISEDDLHNLLSDLGDAPTEGKMKKS